MKLIRLTDDRYVLDAGPVNQERLEAINQYFDEWWQEHSEYPKTMVIGGQSIELEYEDRRDSDLEARVKRLEKLVTQVSGTRGRT
jgi:hypothetical protein